ncbi:pentapeptide repeat-containing protein [Spiroplasma phoeniceum]|uniref:Pentapeptide repeat-containing protein n=1 Tax=Spiroplasma phoeniceum P40 TaxID=1276259 RepID=A0A345DM61_9MOLU|nr:pentapeptide repeat-containing protein [Spiroplasma phoeniceum]AXF95299.1 hypothetical protein SDAV_00305 [Spiroplasma phoeniceum P40]
MKTLQDLIKDLTDITVEQNKINEYLSRECLDLRGADLKNAILIGTDLSGAHLIDADLRGVYLKDIKITKQQ